MKKLSDLVKRTPGTPEKPDRHVARELLKNLDKSIGEDVMGITFDANAWYYDKPAVKEYLAKNIPWSPCVGFWSQDWAAVSLAYFKFLGNYPTFAFTVITLYLSFLAFITILAVAIII